MSSQYVEIADTKLLGIMPSEDWDALEALYPGIHDRIAQGVSAMFDSYLSKRYAAPFATPYPAALMWNVAQVVAGRAYLKRGYNPASQQDQLIKQCHDDALTWLRDAADPEKGLVELPLKDQTGPGNTAINIAAPLSYSENSPYTASDRQACLIRGGSR